MRTEIIYEDAGILVVRKPAGLAVQTVSEFQPDMVSELKNYISGRSGTKNPYLAPVHRLDQPVEGLLVLAKMKEAASDLNMQLAERRLRKKYLAIVQGIPEEKSGTRVDYLKKNKQSNLSAVVSEKERGAKRAELTYRIVAERNMRALAVIEIGTGRHHQIRVQMAHMGYPLLGDIKYGRPGEERGGNPALCAYYLEFINPLTKERQQFEVKPENPAFLEFRCFDGIKMTENAGY